MRNLQEYPVTEQEINDLLAKIVQECTWDDSVGSMDGVILEQTRQIVLAAFDMQRGIEERMKIERNVLRYCTPWKEATLLYKALRGESVYA